MNRLQPATRQRLNDVWSWEDPTVAPADRGEPHRNLLADRVWVLLADRADPVTHTVEVRQRDVPAELGVSPPLVNLAISRLRYEQRVTTVRRDDGLCLPTEKAAKSHGWPLD